MECRQWGAHLPHVAGIAGQSDFGSQSVALSGGYEDDEDHGEWFLYTGRFLIFFRMNDPNASFLSSLELRWPFYHAYSWRWYWIVLFVHENILNIHLVNIAVYIVAMRRCYP